MTTKTSSFQPLLTAVGLFKRNEGWLLLSVGIPLLCCFAIPYTMGYLAHRVTIASHLQTMWSLEQWQHCWLVLPALAAVLYLDRQRLSAIPLRGSQLGLVALLVAYALFWAGYRVDNVYIGYISLHAMVGALILFLGGWRWLWALIFPLLFLAFLWPLYFMEEQITFPLRMVMSRMSEVVLTLVGIDVVRVGTGLVSAADPASGLAQGERFSVDVADPCSGIRSLFALMMISALYGHFTLKDWWQRWLLFFASIPLAILGNLVRILILTLGTILFGAEFAIGRDAITDPSWFHMGAGYAVFAVALGGMLGLGWMLSRLPAWLKTFLTAKEQARPKAAASSDNTDLY